jgi:hypothetical protein
VPLLVPLTEKTPAPDASGPGQHGSGGQGAGDRPALTNTMNRSAESSPVKKHPGGLEEAKCQGEGWNAGHVWRTRFEPTSATSGSFDQSKKIQID